MAVNDGALRPTESKWKIPVSIFFKDARYPTLYICISSTFLQKWPDVCMAGFEKGRQSQLP